MVNQVRSMRHAKRNRVRKASKRWPAEFWPATGVSIWEIREAFRKAAEEFGPEASADRVQDVNAVRSSVPDK